MNESKPPMTGAAPASSRRSTGAAAALPDALSANTLVGSVYLDLRRHIIDGQFPPGARLRVEHLKQRYGAGTGTLREALALLVSDALVVAEGQRGFHVKPMSLDDFQDITQTRILLECQALRQSIEHGDDVWEGRLVAAFHTLSRAEARLHEDHGDRFDDWEARNREFHQALISACTSRWLHHFLAILYRQAERYRRLSVERKPIPRDVQAEHQAILDATLGRDPDTACRLLTQHIGTTFDAVRQLPATEFEAPATQ